MLTKTTYEQLLSEPLNCIETRYDEGFKLNTEQLESVHLTGVQRRFDALRDSVSALRRLADEQDIEKIVSLNDVVPLLFPHTVYKSYPLSILESGKMDRLTRWLDGLTNYDLSGFDCAGLDSIDSWIKRLDETTDLRIMHTSGTTGKLSFIPRTARHWEQMTRYTAHCIRDWNGADSGPDLSTARMPIVQPGYRYGSGATYRALDLMVKQWAGGEDNALFLYNDHFSADIASLAGRLRAAEARGEQGKLELAPGLSARRDEFTARQQQRPEQMKKFLKTAIERFGGKGIHLTVVWSILYEWAEEGLAHGLRQVFGKNSVLVSGGGSKGLALPEDYREQIFDFLGFDNVYEYYGMSELMANCPRCTHGNYHIPPALVPFVLDPETGEALPRHGTQIGRFAFVDLLPDSYWGGFITGDEVTISWWDEPCACGRQGPYLHGQIRRYSEKEGGDDKINCAGAPEAHDRAVDFLLSSTH